MNVTVRPELLRWARERASLAPAELAVKVGSKKSPAPVDEWEQTGVMPLKKLEAWAKKTHTPLGYLFLDEPPDDSLPITDFRRPAERHGEKPSLNLLHTVYDCQFRQSWFSEYLAAEGEEPLRFVGSATVGDQVSEVAADIRATIDIEPESRREASTFEAAMLLVMAKAEAAGVLIERSGVVGSNASRPLNRKEFKGFAIADAYAPLIFINGKDWISSQAFTYAHELAHIWLGVSGVPDGDYWSDPDEPVERFCNAVAGEVLVPRRELVEVWDRSEDVHTTARNLSRRFKVSSLVLLYFARSADLIGAGQFREAFDAEQKAFEEAAPAKAKASGGDYYNTAGTRLGKRFITAVLSSTLSGTTLYREAFDLLGTRKTKVFEGLVQKFLRGAGE